MHEKEFLDAANAIIKILSEDICKECVEKGENLQPVNLADPLTCSCRCEKVKLLIEAAEEYAKSARS